MGFIANKAIEFDDKTISHGIIRLINLAIIITNAVRENTMKKYQNGLTFLELMITVAIVGIIASIALWDSSDMLEENRAENYLLELKRNIAYARSQAASTDED